MKFLIIDSHKGSLKEPQNLHWLNAKKIKDFLNQEGHEVDLIWSYPTVNDQIKSGYDRIIFNHASHYSYVDYAWLKASPEAKLFHITNEYNLGEPIRQSVQRQNLMFHTVHQTLRHPLQCTVLSGVRSYHFHIF
jgi:hypothetical protein